MLIKYFCINQFYPERIYFEYLDYLDIYVSCKNFGRISHAPMIVSSISFHIGLLQTSGFS